MREAGLSSRRSALSSIWGSWVTCGGWRLLLAMLCGVVVAGAAVAADPVFRPRIVNGVFEFGEASTGALLIGSSAETAGLQCTGTMIGCETFLTAAHCICDTDGADCTGGSPPNPGSFFVYLQHGGLFSVTSIALRSEYIFPVADIAVLKLGSPVDGVSPTPINETQTPASGTSGRIVGFGRSGGANDDYGLKRSGDLVTATCTGGISNTTSVCWNFENPVGPPGEDTSTCNGDSGGPLFVDFGSGPVVAGVTSGGDSGSCLAPDAAFDANVFNYRAWVATESGSDLANTSCGTLPQVGGSDVNVDAFSGGLSSGATEGRHVVSVPPGTDRLRIAMNGHDDGFSDFDLYVKQGSPPTTTDAECTQDGQGQFGFCDFPAPAAGDWHILVNHFSGSGTYQVAATRFGAGCAAPGSEGLPCDDDNPCTASDVCTAGLCTGSAVPDGLACDDGNPCSPGDQCLAGVCDSGPAPALSCLQPIKERGAALNLLDRANDKRDRVTWRWSKGAATTIGDFDDPSVGDGFHLCVYDEVSDVASLAYDLAIPPGSLWTPITNGYRYRDKTKTQDGLHRVVLRSGSEGKARILVSASGLSLTPPALPLAQDSSVRVQLLGANACWEATYSTSTRNDSERFKSRSD